MQHVLLVFPTNDGKNAGVRTGVKEEVTICTVNDKLVFELWHQTGEGFKANAELFTPNGYFLKTSDNPFPELFDTTGNQISINNVGISGNVFDGCNVGIWIRNNSLKFCS